MKVVNTDLRRKVKEESPYGRDGWYRFIRGGKLTIYSVACAVPSAFAVEFG
jgi:hypothetical protein